MDVTPEHTFGVPEMMFEVLRHLDPKIKKKISSVLPRDLTMKMGRLSNELWHLTPQYAKKGDIRSFMLMWEKHKNIMTQRYEAFYNFGEMVDERNAGKGYCIMRFLLQKSKVSYFLLSCFAFAIEYVELDVIPMLCDALSIQSFESESINVFASRIYSMLRVRIGKCYDAEELSALTKIECAIFRGFEGKDFVHSHLAGHITFETAATNHDPELARLLYLIRKKAEEERNKRWLLDEPL